MRINILILICLHPSIMLAAKYESLGEAFVVGALSWLVFIAIIFIVKWIIRLSKKALNTELKTGEMQMRKEKTEKEEEQINIYKETSIHNNSIPNSNQRESSMVQCSELQRDSSTKFSITNGVVNTKILFCKYCGKKIDQDSVFCPYCGLKLFDNSSSSTIFKEKEDNEETIGVNSKNEETIIDARPVTKPNIENNQSAPQVKKEYYPPTGVNNKKKNTQDQSNINFGWLMLIAFVLIILIIGGAYFFNSQSNNYSQFTNDTEVVDTMMIDSAVVNVNVESDVELFVSAISKTVETKDADGLIDVVQDSKCKIMDLVKFNPEMAKKYLIEVQEILKNNIDEISVIATDNKNVMAEIHTIIDYSADDIIKALSSSLEDS